MTTSSASTSEFGVADRVERWDAALGAVRSFLRGEGLREVSTPTRVPTVALEPYIEPIAAPPGLLATSPELAMKRLLCRGAGSIFQISHVFRRAEIGARHSEEFHLVEWYRVGEGLERVQADVEALVNRVFTLAGREGPRVWERRGFLDLVRETCGLRLRGDEDEAALRLGSAGVGLDLGAPSTATDPDVRRLAAWTAFLSAWSDRDLDPLLAATPGQAVHVVDFPPALAALAEVSRGRAGRFESYVGGVELANGYRELRDADEQRRRFDVVAGLRASLGLPALPLDLAFLADLRDLGLPACCGVALGLDRLLMVAAGADTLAALTLSLAPRVGEPGT